MNISEIKDLLAQFDASTLREFSYKNNGEELNLSKNQTSSVTAAPVAPTVEVVAPAPQAPVAPVAAAAAVETPATPVEEASAPAQAAEGEVIESPLVGVAYLSPSPEKPAFVSVGDTVKKGQTLLIVEAMKVMNEVPAPKDGVITEILVTNEEVVGHFPQYPVMPGVLIMEALAQTAGVLELSKPENKGKLVFYAGMDKVKFKKQVVPGDQLVMTAKFVKRRGTIAVVEAKAEVDGKLAASGTLTFAIGS